MSSPSGLFYAYAKNITDDWSYRYLITFATRDVADTWWRAVTDSVAGGYQTFATVSRVTPQFYTHNPAIGNIMNTINDERVALSLRGQMFFTLVIDRDGRDLSIAPVLNYTDHISGGRYYIRSSQQPNTYWYYDTSSNLVRASSNQRTKFTISLANGSNQAGKVMIGTDDILITLGSGTNIGIDNSVNQLGTSSGPFPFKFSEFNGDFQIAYDNATAGNLGPISRNIDAGEKWELA